MSMELEHVSFTYSKGTPYEKEVLHDISLTIEKVILRQLSVIRAAANRR